MMERLAGQFGRLVVVGVLVVVLSSGAQVGVAAVLDVGVEAPDFALPT